MPPNEHFNSIERIVVILRTTVYRVCDARSSLPFSSPVNISQSRVHRSLCRACPGCHRVMKVSHQLSPLASRTDIATIDQRSGVSRGGGASARTSPVRATSCVIRPGIAAHPSLHSLPQWRPGRTIRWMVSTARYRLHYRSSQH